MKAHPLFGGLWLAATLGGIVVGGFYANGAAKVKAETRARDEVRERMGQAVMAGRAGRYADAAKMLRALQAEYPKSTSIALNLGIAYRALEMPDEALAEFDKVLAHTPEDWDAVAEVASIHLEKGDLEAALATMEKIPAGEGQVEARLRGDAVWTDLEATERLQALRTKHGVGERADTSTRRLQEMERRRREFERANPATPRPPAEGEGSRETE